MPFCRTESGNYGIRFRAISAIISGYTGYKFRRPDGCLSRTA